MYTGLKNTQFVSVHNHGHIPFLSEICTYELERLPTTDIAECERVSPRHGPVKC